MLGLMLVWPDTSRHWGQPVGRLFEVLKSMFIRIQLEQTGVGRGGRGRERGSWMHAAEGYVQLEQALSHRKQRQKLA